MRRAMSCANWLPKSRIRMRSVMGRASFCFRFLRTSLDQGIDLGPAIGHLLDERIAQLPLGAGLVPAAQAIVETAVGIALEGPEHEIAMAEIRKALGEAAQQKPADALAITVGGHIEAIDLGGVSVDIALDHRLLAQRRAAAGNAGDRSAIDGDQGDDILHPPGRTRPPLLPAQLGRGAARRHRWNEGGTG